MVSLLNLNALAFRFLIKIMILRKRFSLLYLMVAINYSNSYSYYHLAQSFELREVSHCYLTINDVFEIQGGIVLH